MAWRSALDRSSWASSRSTAARMEAAAAPAAGPSSSIVEDWCALDAMMLEWSRTHTGSEPRKRQLLTRLDPAIWAAMADDVLDVVGPGWIAHLWAVVAWFGDPLDLPSAGCELQAALQRWVDGWNEHGAAWHDQLQLMYDYWPETEELLRRWTTNPSSGSLRTWLEDLVAGLDMEAVVGYSTGSSARARRRRARLLELVDYLGPPPPPPSLPPPPPQPQ